MTIETLERPGTETDERKRNADSRDNMCADRRKAAGRQAFEPFRLMIEDNPNKIFDL